MEVPRHWRLKAQRYRLEGSVCPDCGQVAFPPRPVCPQCTAQRSQIAGGGPFHVSILSGKANIDSQVPADLMERVIR